MRHRVVVLVFVLLLLCSCASKEYVPQMTSEQAIACALEEGQRYLAEEFEEWKSWEESAAEFQSIELELMVDGKYERTERIWHVVFTGEEDNRSVNFVVDDTLQAVVGGWDSVDAAVDWKEQPRQEYLYTAEDAIIRAILYYKLDVELPSGKRTALPNYMHVYVYLDNFGELDRDRVCDLDHYSSGKIKRRRIPLGQAWRVTFCAHTEEEQQEWYHFDMQVAVGGEECAVFGYTHPLP